ncbi:MAG: type II toxin-antitoxin system VapC family toxin [Thermodesulfobacteriota bacterium]
MDSSALAKRYIQEAGSDKLASLLLNASELALCIIVVPEIVSGLNRRMREGFLAVADYRAAKRQLLDDVRDATILQITPAVVSRSLRLLENGNLRAMDALHVACALEWRSDLFVTSDSRQSLAAGNAGLRSEYLGNS